MNNFLMNSLTNKAKLWDQCIEQGLFNNVHKDNVSKIQPMFESTIDMFITINDDIEILNRDFMIKMKEELNKLNSFEERQKDYDQLLNNPKPKMIDFSDKLDEPIKNMDLLLEKTQNNRQEIFKSVDKQLTNNSLIDKPFEQQTIDWGSVIKKQNDILIKILETQQTILQLLKK
jgi:hypothetical protein